MYFHILKWIPGAILAGAGCVELVQKRIDDRFIAIAQYVDVSPVGVDAFENDSKSCSVASQTTHKGWSVQSRA